MILVWFLDLKFLYELAATLAGTSNPPHECSAIQVSLTTVPETGRHLGGIASLCNRWKREDKRLRRDHAAAPHRHPTAAKKPLLTVDE
jgi:hypothetical protein